MTSAPLGIALGYLADAALGDPARFHPVAGFGQLTGRLEQLLWRDSRVAGALYTALCVGGTVAAGAGLVRAVRRSPAAGAALAAATTWSVLGGASLAREAQTLARCLEDGDLAAARERLPRLCGRDPQSLDSDGIARAVVESVAENTSDAVVGALLWGAVAGVPGMAAFRAANTLDAMVGHRSPRHLRFGWASARLDDAVGRPGARLTAALATVLGPDHRAALRSWRLDAAGHPSPNAGVVEAAFAGALGVRLGGTLAYGGRVEHRAVLNPEGRLPEAADIARAVALSRRVGHAALVLALGGARARRALHSRRARATAHREVGS
ncbi:cobalamin biosynthesis protein [Streptomyces sp. P38-E01]|uniref:Cobalamin biosynthesis protein CobD n=1 Tax=Streptomyces tardus TaxID=2780544 RepID=A0A949JGI4_9ACTN|nr:cobalamin biosynthesis protein [Streptomyces tardus]MBU7599708.1 cobalamin biosynthesis protein [Streptomyces tardus]